MSAHWVHFTLWLHEKCAEEFRVNRDDTDNLPPLPGIFPDIMATVGVCK